MAPSALASAQSPTREPVSKLINFRYIENMEEPVMDTKEPWAIQLDDKHVIVWLNGVEGDGKLLTNEQARILIAALQHALGA